MPITHFVFEKSLFGRHLFALPLQVAAQKVLRGPRETTFRFQHGPAKGKRFTCSTGNKYFFVRGSYERELLAPLSRIVKPGMIAYDIGAHFGYWTLVLSVLCGPTGKVFAFEPSAANREMLRRNVADNGLGNVEIVPLAASDRQGVIGMTNDGSMAKLGGSEEVEAVRLDDFCRNHPQPDFLMIDVEGHAAAVLAGCSGLAPFQLVCELHNEAEKLAVAEIGDVEVETVSATPFPYRVVAAAPI